MTENKELHKLEDVVVDTLGLVTHGANQEEFFLLKSADTADVEPLAKSIWQRLAQALRGQITEELTTLVKADNQAAEVNEFQDESEMVTKLVIEPNDVEELEAPIVMKEEIMEEKEQVPVTEVAVDKSDLTAQLAELAKANADLLARVEKAEREAAIEKDRREYQVWLTKARALYTLPASADDMAEQLHWLAKTDSARAQWWEAQLAALTNQMRDSELFVEKGTSRVAQDNVKLVEKAERLVGEGKFASLKDALLALPREEQYKYLTDQRQMRGEVA